MLKNVTREDTSRLAALSRAVMAHGYRFVTPTPATHARVVARPGRAWARDLRDVFGWSLPFRPGTLPGDVEDALAQADAADAWEDGWRSRVRLSTLDGAAFLHSAYPTSQADAVFFGPDTYRFAASIAGVLDRPVGRAVDIGCGAGPGAIVIARAHAAAEVLAVDINDSALRLTRGNAAAAGVAVTALRSDVLEDVEGRFDLIVSNPPYMADPGRRAYRDGGGALGSALSLRILESASRRLAPGGTLLLYTGSAIVEGADPFREAAASVLAGSGLDWSYREVDPDVFGEELEAGPYVNAERIAAVVLTANNRE